MASWGDISNLMGGHGHTSRNKRRCPPSSAPAAVLNISSASTMSCLIFHTFVPRGRSRSLNVLLLLSGLVFCNEFNLSWDLVESLLLHQFGGTSAA